MTAKKTPSRDDWNAAAAFHKPLEIDPDKWKENWKPLDVNGKWKHLRCNGRPGPETLRTFDNKTEAQFPDSRNEAALAAAIAGKLSKETGGT